MRTWVDQMKSAPRGPFERIRWFCADGAVLPPGEGVCREHGGGVQHGEWNSRAQTLRNEGYLVASLLASPTDRGLRIGPCVARETSDARSLVAAAVATASGRPVLVGLPAPNADGLEMLAEMGFERGASSFRMRLGPPLDAGDPTHVFAIASGAAG